MRNTLDIYEQVKPVLAELVFLFILLWKGKWIFTHLFFKPLAGGNGVIQMNEFAQANLIAMCWYCFIKEAGRLNLSDHVFSAEVFLILIFGVLAVAGIKHVAKQYTDFKSKTNDNPDKTDTK